MEKLFVILALTLLIGGSACPAFADDNDDTHWVQLTDRGTYTTPVSGLTTWLNTNDDFYHGHSIYLEKRRNPVGIGVDVVCYQGLGLLEEVTIESKFDWQNDEGSIFAVGRINAFKAIKGFFK